MDLRAFIFVMGTANQRVAGFRDRFHTVLVGPDVDSLLAKDFD
jgi:hypothetical protein